MKTLYDILEVSEGASQEIIEKAYKVLAKKYHPDLQAPENRAKAETRMKEINDAYDTLSDSYKRSNYDAKLAEQRRIEQERIANQAIRQTKNEAASQVKKEYTTPNVEQKEQPVYYQNINLSDKEQRKMKKKLEKEIQEKYQEAYDDYYRRMGYKVPHRWTWKNIRDIGIAIGIMLLIFLLLWIIPPTHDFLVSLYETNFLVRIIVNLVKAIWDMIIGMIVGIFQMFFGKK